MSVTTSSYWWRTDKAELQQVVDSANPVAQDMVTLASVAASVGKTVAACKTILFNSYSSETSDLTKVNNNIRTYGGYECIAAPLALTLL